MYTVKDYLHIVWQWLCWTLFDYAGVIFQYIDLILFNIRVGAKAAKSEKLAVVSKILFRYKKEPLDYFLCKRQYLTEAETVIDSDRVVLHSLDRQFATFVEQPKPLTHYSASNAPFAFIKFHDDAIRTITIPISELHRLADLCGDVQTPTIIVHAVPRSGSTLLCKLAAVSNPGIFSLSEPDAFTCLADITTDAHSHEDDHRIVSSVLRFFCRKMDGVDAFLIKLCHSSSLAPHIQQVAPQMKQVRITRRNALASVASYVRVFHKFRFHKLTYLAANHPLLRPLLPPVPVFPAPIEWAAAESGLRWSMVELMCRRMACDQLLCESHDEYYDEKFYYEDIVRDPERTIAIMHGLLGLKIPNLDDRVIQNCMKQDSQGGTPYSWAVGKSQESILESIRQNPELKQRIEKFFILLPLKEVTISSTGVIHFG